MTCDVLQLLDSYIMSSREQSLNTAACRLLHNIMPGVETAVIFQEKVTAGGGGASRSAHLLLHPVCV